jgi:hypothetical protein
MSIASTLLSENRLVVAQVATLDASKEIDSEAMRVAKVKADIQLFLQDSDIRWSDAAKSAAQQESEAEDIRAGERASMNFVSYWPEKKKYALSGASTACNNAQREAANRYRMCPHTTV